MQSLVSVQNRDVRSAIFNDLFPIVLSNTPELPVQYTVAI